MATGEKFDRPLLAFALLAQLSPEGGRDLLSGLAPIFKLIAKRKVGKRFHPSDFAKEVAQLYFIDVHPWAAEDLAPRLERAGLLKRNESAAAGVHEYVYAEIPGEFSDVSEAEIRLVVRRFIDFAAPVLSSHVIELDEKTLEGVFFEQLIKMDFQAILRKPQVAEVSPTTLTAKKSAERVEAESTLSTRARMEVLCASFILEMHRQHKDVYDLLVRIASGGMVAETVLNFQNPGPAVSLEKLTVILDAPFLMALLDLASEEQHDYSKKLCTSLVDHGATLGAFRHSAEEIRDNLMGVIALTAQRKGFGPTARRLNSAAFSEYANAVRANPESSITQLGVRLVALPSSATLFQHFTQEEEDAYFGALGRYENPLAQRRDAASVAAVVRHRGGRRIRMSNFQQTNYLFVTENPNLAATARNFLTQRKLLATDEVPVAMTDKYLAGLLLILYGGKAAEFTQYRLLANCASALEARSDVVSRMHRFLNQVSTQQANKFRALMTVERAGQHLMQLTLGESILVTDTNAAAILEDIEKVLVEKQQQAFRAEMAEMQQRRDADADAHRQEREAAATEVLDARTEALLIGRERDEAGRRAQQLEEAIKARDAADFEERRRRVRSAMSFAHRWEQIAHYFLACAIAALAGWLTWLGMGVPRDSGQGLLIALAVGALAFLAFWKFPEIIFGGAVRAARDRAFRFRIRVYGLENHIGDLALNWETKDAVRASGEEPRT
jgi:hypothetical protein